MMAYTIRRIVQAIPLVLVVSLVVYFLIEIQPGDPIIDNIRLANPRITAEEIANLRTLYGLDKPIAVRYTKWLGKALQGDLGYSRIYRIPALQYIVKQRLPNTLALSGLAFFFAIVIAIPMGIIVAIRQYSILDYVVSFLNFIGFSMPVFWLGIMLIILTSLVITVPTTQGSPKAPFAGTVEDIENIEIKSGNTTFTQVTVVINDGTTSRNIPMQSYKPIVKVGDKVKEKEILGRTRKELLPAGGFTSGVKLYTTKGSPISNVAGIATMEKTGNQTNIKVEGFLGTETYEIPKGYLPNIEDGQRVRNNQQLAKRYTFWQTMRFLGDRLRHIILPAFALSIIQMAQWTRFMRSSMLEVMNQDYVRTARAKGVNENIVIYKHTLRNALIPIITLIGLALPGLISGAVLTETVFSWPGMGTALLESLISKDYNVAMVVIVLLSILTIAFNLLADLAYAIADPRIQYR